MNCAEVTKSVFIFACCKDWQHPFFDSLKNNDEQIWEWASNPAELSDALDRFEPRYIFFTHWNWVVPDSIWKTRECVCFHMTDLPYGRGGSPLQNLIISGRKSTKLTALRMVQEMDAGPIYAKRDLELAGSAQDIYLNAAKLSTKIIKWIIANNPTPFAQKGEIVLFKRRKPEQSILPMLNQEVNVFDFIRMLDADGYPHAFIDYGDFRLEFREAKKQGEAVIAQVRITTKINGDPK